MEESIVFIVAATTGRGDPPSNMRVFWDRIMDAELPEDALEHLHFSIFGLGDSSYENYNCIARALHKRFNGLGAQEFVARGLGDDQEIGGYLKSWNLWLDSIISKCLNIFHSKNLSQQFPLMISLLSKWNQPNLFEGLIQNPFYSEMQNLVQNKTQPDIPKIIQKCENFQAFQLSKTQEIDLFSWKKCDYIPIKVLSNKLMTAEDHFQKVYHLQLQLTNSTGTDSSSFFEIFSKLQTSFNPGDCLQIIYKNSIEDAKKLIKYFPDEAETPFFFRSFKSHKHFLHESISPDQGQTLSHLLVNYFDINKPLDFDSIKKLGQYTELEEIYQEKLEEMDYEEYIDYVVREKRNLSEILFDFRVKKLDPAFLFNSLHVLRPREYSVAGLAYKKETNSFGKF
jgi:sulfite reductase alpha subunit-like flavoprotein